ncbi:MAG: hypothetical protein ABEJ65_05405 [bacterium]
MSPNPEPGSFQPKILIIGRTNSVRSSLLEASLTTTVNRYGVISAGFEPDEEVRPEVKKVATMAGWEQPEPPAHISVSVNENLRLIVHVSERVRLDAPIVAAPCDKVTLGLESDLVPPGNAPPDDYNRLKQEIENEARPRILEEVSEKST